MDSPELKSYFACIIRLPFDDSEAEGCSQVINREEVERLALASQESSPTFGSTQGAIEKQSSLQRVTTDHFSLVPSSHRFDFRALMR